MKKTMMALAALVAWPLFCAAQTVAIEEAYLNKCITEKKWDQAAGADRVKEWRLLKDSYPALPFDTAEQQVVVEHVIAFAGISKTQAWKRVKEWAALHFGSLAEVTDYEDAESGRIIFEGSALVTFAATFENLWGTEKSVPASRSLHFSLVVTVKDGKARLQYNNLTFHYTVGGYFVGPVYMPVERIQMPLSSVLPITSGQPGTWRGSLDLLNQALAALHATAPSLERYIRRISSDSDF